MDPAAGPVQRFAFELRELRAAAGGITYRALARRAGYSVTTLSQAAAGERLPTLAVALAYAGACGGDLADWEARWRDAVTKSADDGYGFREDAGPGSREGGGDGSQGDGSHVPRGDGSHVPRGDRGYGSRGEGRSLTPYRGLARFEVGDSALFFGRERLTADLLGLLDRRRFAAVFGPSGSGKSSLLRAGLIPVLRQIQEPDRRPAAIRVLTPGEHPARTHAHLLTPAASAAPGADTFLIVDQFEEVFTLCRDPAERARFIDLLLTARQPESRLRVLIAVRGDFYGRCAEHRDLADALRDANLLAGAMSPAELRDAVVKPATAAGLIVERALTARLVEEVADAPGGLPLLSHALLETWRRRRGKTLTMTGYEAAGCLDGAIAETAERVYGRFTEAQTATARRVLLRLVAPGDGTPDTRRPVDRAELPGTTGRDGTPHVLDDTAQVLEAFTAVRLLTLDGDTVEMAHEALITGWPRLRGWIEEDRERLRVHRNLTEAAHAWEQLGREQGALYRGSRLATAQEHFGAAGESRGRARERFGAARHQVGRARQHLGVARQHLGGARQHVGSAEQHAGSTEQHAGSAEPHAGSAEPPVGRARPHPRSAPREDLTDLERAFLDAGTAYERRGRRRYRLVLAAVTAALCLALVAAGLAVGQWRSAVTAQHLAESRQLAAQSGALLDSDPDRAALLAVRAYRTSPTGEATAALYAAAALPLRKRLVDGTEPVGTLALSPDGHTVATHSADGRLRIWDLPEGRLRHTVPTGHTTGDAAEFSPDGRTLALATAAEDGVRVGLWDPATGRELRTFTVPDGAVRGLAFSPDGRTVAASSSAAVRVWDTTTGRTRRTFAGRLDPRAVAFGPDGRTIAAASHDGRVRVWDLATGRTRTAHDSGGEGDALVFSPDGRTYAVRRTDGSVHLRDVATGTVRRTLRDGPAGWTRMAFAPDGRTLAVPGPGDRVHLWDTASGATLGTVTAGHLGRGVTTVALGAAGRTLVTSGNLDAEVRVHRVLAGQPRTVLAGRADGAVSTAAGETSVTDVAFGPDGRSVATVHQGPPGAGSVQLWDARTGDRRATLALDTTPAPQGERLPVAVSRLAAVGFGPNGRALAARAVGNRGIEVRDIATGRLLGSRPLDDMDKAVFSPDGTRLAGVGAAGAVRIWHLPTGAPRTVRAGSGTTVRSVAFSPDGHTLAVVDIGSYGDRIALLDTTTGRTRHTLTPNAGGSLSVAFSRDGRTLASASSGSVQTWDTRTGRLRESLDAGGEVGPAAFSPDGRTIAVSGTSGVELWDLATGLPRTTLPTRSPTPAAFSPDGHTLAVGTADSVAVWSIDLPAPAEAIDTICESVDPTAPDCGSSAGRLRANGLVDAAQG